jgi:zona occludens toxin
MRLKTMINLLVGPPGGGKSYEATVFHILPALKSGRKVITNLPLDLVRLNLLGFDTSLVEIREKTLAVEPEKDWQKAEQLYSKFGIAAKSEFWVDRVFAHPEDYGHPWRHAVTGSGPLYVIDECHLALPYKLTKREVEEWYSLHRHESADVLLITQSYGKVSKSIIDLVQVCYRVKKATAFGSATKYIRKVQDGVRGDVVNESIREYEKKYFGLYKSHTRGGGVELAAQDIVPIWRRWPFIGAALCFVLVGLIFSFSNVSVSPLKNGLKDPKPVSTVTVETVNGKVVNTTIVDPVLPPVASAPTQSPPAAPGADTGLPYEGRQLHIKGFLRGVQGVRVLFAVSQNGQGVSEVESRDLIALGYAVDPVTPCAVRVSNGSWSRWIICDAPQVSVVPSSSASRSSGAAPPSPAPSVASPVSPVAVSPVAAAETSVSNPVPIPQSSPWRFKG